MSNGEPFRVGITDRRKGHHVLPLQAHHLGDGIQHITEPIELFSHTTAPYYRFLDERERDRIEQTK